MKNNGKGALGKPAAAATPEEEFLERRRAMVAEQIRERGVGSPRVLDALLAVPRHKFVPFDLIHEAYTDRPLPIGHGQTISQPYMVAVMIEALELTGSERVLEVGTGSGYQAAVISLLASEVYTVENNSALARAAERRLVRLGYPNAHVQSGDGTLGLPAFAPFEAIVVAAAAPHVPPPLIEQLAEGGRLVIPVGQSEHQELLQLRKTGGKMNSRALHDCRFVPLVGRHGWRSHSS